MAVASCDMGLVIAGVWYRIATIPPDLFDGCERMNWRFMLLALNLPSYKLFLCF